MAALFFAGVISKESMRGRFIPLRKGLIFFLLFGGRR